MLQPNKLPFELRLSNSQLIIIEFLKKKFKYFSVKETKSGSTNNYLEIITGHGHASAAYGT